MTHNDIYDQIRRETSQYPVYYTLKPPIDYKLTQHQINAESGLKDYTKPLNGQSQSNVTSRDQTDLSDRLTLYSTENSRKAKKVPDLFLDNDVKNIIVLPETNSKIFFNEKQINTTNDPSTVAESTNTYEVTEDNDKFLDPDENEPTEDTGYQYIPPTEEHLNLTSKFYKILSKYNINSGDKLQNYDFSLKHKVRNSLTDVNKFPLPNRYNSLNHLPVDPLLAVFLSNYGFYLPSLYGIKSNYNNLYGYLASNNIHNNKPFGLYKIFSDTDSWS